MLLTVATTNGLGAHMLSHAVVGMAVVGMGNDGRATAASRAELASASARAFTQAGNSKARGWRRALAGALQQQRRGSRMRPCRAVRSAGGPWPGPLGPLGLARLT